VTERIVAERLIQQLHAARVAGDLTGMCRVFADDGLTMSAIQYGTKAVLQPGYRADALVVFPKAGDYCVVNAQVSAASSVSRDAAATRLLGAVHVTGSSPIDNVQTWVMNALANRARTSMPPDVRAEIINDLTQGLRLTKFTPHPTITPVATGLKYEWCRNSSRAKTLEMCTSISGALNSAQASRNAIEVWVNPPALRITGSLASAARWIQSSS